MAKYSDVIALMRTLSTMYKEPTSAKDYMTIGYNKAVADAVVTVHRQPAADVVEVVRCKECSSRSIVPNSDGHYWCNQWYASVFYENGYCYKAQRSERREDADKTD